MTTIIFTNQKGGVGKTTLTREIGLYLGTKGYSILLVDCDAQGNLTKSLPADPDAPGLFAALDGTPCDLQPVASGVDLLSG